MKYKLLAGIILLIPVLMFVQMNIAAVPVHFLRWERSVPLSLLLLGTLLAGAVLGMLFSFARKRNKAKKLKKAEREKQKQAEEAQKPAAQEPIYGVDIQEKTVIPGESNSYKQDKSTEP